MAWVYLDDQFFDHPKAMRAGGDACWLFVCGLGYCRRQETDGRIPKAAVPMLSDRKQPMKIAGRLVDVGLWVDDGEFFLVHDYTDWNRPQESRRAAARKAAKARWDAERNADASDTHSKRIAKADASACPPPHPPPSVDSSSSSQPLSRPPSEEEDPRFAECWTLLAQVDAEAYTAKGNTIRSRGWFTAAAETRRLAHERQAASLLADHPDWTARQLADSLTTPTSPDDRVAAAAAAIRERNDRRARGEACERCQDRGVVEDDDGTVTDCDCKYRRSA